MKKPSLFTRPLASVALLAALLPIAAGCPGIIEIKSKQAASGPAKSTVPPILYEDFEKGYQQVSAYSNADGGASVNTGEEDTVVHSGKKAMHANYKSGTGSWGCGWGIGTNYMPKSGYFNARGTLGVELWAKAARGATFQISVTEGKQNGGDGEVYLAAQGTGSGAWKRYFFPWDGFTRSIYSGNQAGDDHLEIGSIGGIDVQIAEKQGDGTIYIDDIYFK